MAGAQWKLLLDGCCSTELGPTDSEVATGILTSASPNSSISVAVRSISEHANRDEQCQEGPLSPEALREVQALIDGLDPECPRSSTFLLSVLTVFKLAPPYAAAHALSSEGSWRLVDALLQLHKRSRNLGSMPTQLVVALIAFTASSCEAASVSNDPLSSRPLVSEALISHLVFLAPRVEELHTQRGLATAARALRTLFALSMSGTRHGRDLAQLCHMADVPGRVLQALAHDTTQLLAPTSAFANGTPQAHALQQPREAGLYVQLLAAGVTYLGVSSGMFHAPGGRRVLDGPSLRSSRAWLLVPGRLQALRRPLQDAAALGLGLPPPTDGAAPGGGLAPGAPEHRAMACSALRNLVLTLALPLCTSKSQDDVVELMEFAMRYSHSLHEAGYLSLLQHLAQCGQQCVKAGLAQEEQQLCSFVGCASGSLLRAVEVIGGRLDTWGVKLQRPFTLPASGPEFGCSLTFPSDSQSGVSADDAQAFIKEQIPFVLDVGNQLLAAVQLANV